MGLFTSARAHRRGRVTFLQLVSSLAGFLLFSVLAGVLLAGLVLPAVTVAGQGANGASEVFESLPKQFDETTLPQKSSIYANDGTTLLATFFTQNRVVVPLQDISPWMQRAQVAVEDRRFWEHHGVDGEGLLRVAYLMSSGEDTQGASTITQQLVKNTLLQAAVAEEDDEGIAAATEPTVARKVREWRLALAYEEKLNELYGDDCSADPQVDCGKEQVLESYLNIAQYGTRVYGVEAASQFYFGIPAKELTALQAATIAGVTQNPTKWDPVRNPDNSQIRRNIVLTVMQAENPDEMSLEELQVLKQVPLEATLNITYPKFSCAASELAPFFCDYVTKVISKDEAFNGNGNTLLYQGGLKIVTTLDARMQQEANDSLRRGVPEDDPSGVENALVALDVTTGNILAMAQNRDFDPTSQAPNSTAINYATDRDYGGSRGFSPGSSFKPIILAAWLDSGRGLNQVVSGDVREWQQSEFKASCDGITFVGKWRPQNSEPSENKQTNVLDATAYSVNTAYVSMAQQLDLCAIRDMAASLGFHRADGLDFEIVPSISLGTQNASPLSMASAYQTFANRGIHCEPRAIVSIEKLNGEPVPDPTTNNDVVPPPVECAQAIKADVADGVTYAMTKVFEYGTARRVDFDRPAAGKTGTAQNSTHLWFVGYTPQIVTAVWAGNADVDTPLRDMAINGSRVRAWWYGGDIAAPIWADFMTTALEPYSVVGLPGPSASILAGMQVPVPDVVLLPEDEAKEAINDAGFFNELSPELLYRPDVPPGTIVDQYPDAGTMLTVGSTVTYYLSTDSYPAWWSNWPSGWDPMVPPSDYWGKTWPPDGWVPNRPSNGWNPSGPDPTPTPTPTPGP